MLGVVAELLQDFFRLCPERLRRQTYFRYLAVITHGMADEGNRRPRRPFHNLEALVVNHLRIDDDVGIVVDAGVPDSASLKQRKALRCRAFGDVGRNCCRCDRAADKLRCRERADRRELKAHLPARRAIRARSRCARHP